MWAIAAAMLQGLLLTLLVELSLAALLKVRGWDLVIIGLINCLTNPIVNYIFNWAWVLFKGQPLFPYLILAALELAVLFFEALLFKKLLHFRKIGALKLSLILNSASFAAGLLITIFRVII